MRIGHNEDQADASTFVGLCGCIWPGGTGARGYPPDSPARHPAEHQKIASFPLRWWKTSVTHECAVPDANELGEVNQSGYFSPRKFKRNNIILLERT